MRSASRKLNWLPYSACAVAFAALAFAVLWGFQPHLSQNAGSDFKTLYASTWCFVHGRDAFSFQNLAQVFEANNVIEPRSWYGHSPVYPPLTLALLAPLCLLPMVAALNLWIVLSAACMGLATAALLHAASERFHWNLAQKLLLVTLCAGSPLTEIGLELGNVSVAAAALGVFAVAAPRGLSPWLRVIAIALSLLLKPHIALWIVLAYLFAWSRPRLAVVVRVCGIMAAFGLLYAVWGLVHHSLFTQFGGYRAIVLSELANGSMSPGNRDVMEVFVQITSFSSLIGYWLGQHAIASLLNIAFLLLLVAALGWACWKLRARADERFLEMAGAWSALGLVATYHRDADAMVLMLALPLLLTLLRRNLNHAWAWCLLLSIVAGCYGPSADSLHMFTDPAPPNSLFRFVLLRQAGLSVVAVTLLLIGRAVLHSWSLRRESPGDAV